MGIARMMRLATLSAAAGAAAFILAGPVAPTAQANAMYPDDCTVTNDTPVPTRDMTCTGRPAGQRWQIVLNCTIGQSDRDVAGTVVTGNGTSVGHCPPNTRSVFVWFQTV
ncbi:hypothetical protein [Amycolatopsis vastitatis]|nr:hypothetical protein [Amycolatopsis vastitatis]